MSESEKEVWSAGKLFVALFVVLPGCILANGFALDVLWRWFVVPFFGVRALTLGLACGFCALLMFFRRSVRRSGGITLTDAFTDGIVMPLMVAGEGWLIKTMLM